MRSLRNLSFDKINQARRRDFRTAFDFVFFSLGAPLLNAASALSRSRASRAHQSFVPPQRIVTCASCSRTFGGAGATGAAESTGTRRPRDDPLRRHEALVRARRKGPAESARGVQQGRAEGEEDEVESSAEVAEALMIVFSISGSAKSARSRAARRRHVVPAARNRIHGARRAPSAGSRSASGATAGGPGNIYIHLLSSAEMTWKWTARHRRG